MKRIILTAIIVFSCGISIYSQRITGIINPGEQFINHTGDSLYFLPVNKLRLLVEFHERFTLAQKLNDNLENQLKLKQQLIQNKEDEIRYWKNELHRVDMETEQIRIEYEYLEEKWERGKRGRKWWFVGGVVVGVVLSSLPHP